MFDKMITLSTCIYHGTYISCDLSYLGLSRGGSTRFLLVPAQGSSHQYVSLLQTRVWELVTIPVNQLPRKKGSDCKIYIVKSGV